MLFNAFHYWFNYCNILFIIYFISVRLHIWNIFIFSLSPASYYNKAKHNFFTFLFTAMCTNVRMTCCKFNITDMWIELLFLLSSIIIEFNFSLPLFPYFVIQRYDKNLINIRKITCYMRILYKFLVIDWHNI